VPPGHVGLFEASVSFEIERVNGIKNMFFGADSIFLAKLTGAGKLWLQTLPLANLANALEPYLPQASADSGNKGFSINFGND